MRFLLLFFFATSIFAQITPIQELHKNNKNGVPVAPFDVNTTVTVQGIVTVGTGIFSDNYFDVYIQDETGGINVFSFSPPTNVNIGDYVRVTGKIAHYNGLTEIIPSNVTIISSDNKKPTPKVLTCIQLANSFQQDYSEPDEGRLVEIKNVHIEQNLASGLYSIRDQTGTCLLYLDIDTGVPEPSGTFNVTGILKQYDKSSPYTSGYEIIPRFVSDIDQDIPLFNSQPVEKTVNSTNVTIECGTTELSNVEFFFWEKDGAQNKVSSISKACTDHTVLIDNLTPSTFYYGIAKAFNDFGSSFSDTLLFMTAYEQEGTISTFFTKSVDHSLADPDSACGFSDFSQIIVAQIATAKTSIDICYYSFNHNDIVNALIDARRRNVAVRFIYEGEKATRDADVLEQFQFNGIDVVIRPAELDGIMHNKFIVGDEKWVWMGSANAIDGTFDSENHAQNNLLIHDKSLAKTYSIEFNEMWSGTFGEHKKDNTPHKFNVAGSWVEQYMSPSDYTEQHIIDAINTADYSVYFCGLILTSNGIEQALKTKLHSNPDFKLMGVLDAGNLNASGSAYDNMIGSGDSPWVPAADVFPDALDNFLHHKYMLIDAQYPDSDPIVITGSHNWTNSANTKNDENTIIIHDKRIANLFVQEFAERYRESGGTQFSSVESNPVFVNDFQLLQNYPNPFNGSTTITVNVQDFENYELFIYDVTGSLVKTINLPPHPGLHSVHWNGTNNQSLKVGSGVYFAQLGEKSHSVLKMLLIQ